MKTETFPGVYLSLARISDFIQQAASEAGLDEIAAYAVQTAVDEACSNIIEHAYGGEGHGDIICSVAIDPTSLTVVLHDHGRPFDPLLIRDPDIRSIVRKNKAGGLGLYFIRKLMDEVVFEFDPQRGNTLTLVKRKEKPS